MAFFQEPPTLPNPFRGDRVLRSYLDRALPPDVRAAVLPELEAMGEIAGGPLQALSIADRKSEPVHTPFDPWGRRVDRIELTPLWKEAATVAAERGLVATAYERKHGEHSRIHQFALVYLFDPSTGVYTLPAGDDRRRGEDALDATRTPPSSSARSRASPAATRRRRGRAASG